MSVIYPADVLVAYFQSALQFRTEQASKPWFRALNGNPFAELAVHGLIHHAHAAFPNFADHKKTFRDFLRWLERLLRLLRLIQVNQVNERMGQKISHPFFPLNNFSHLGIEVLVVLALKAEEPFAFRLGETQCLFRKRYYGVVVFCAALHCLLLNRSKSHFRPSNHSRSTVRWPIPNSPAVSCGVRPR